MSYYFVRSNLLLCLHAVDRKFNAATESKFAFASGMFNKFIVAYQYLCQDTKLAGLSCDSHVNIYKSHT